jgi:hypothetical protein
MCEPLVGGRVADDFVLHFGQEVDTVRYVLVLPEGETASVEPVGFTDDDERYRVRTATNAAGLTEVSLVARGVPARHRFGLRLELE